MRIKAVNSKVLNINLSIPYDGIVKIDENGEVSVSEKAGKILVESGHWTLIENESGVEEVEEVDELQEILNGIKKMSLPELVNTAEEAGYSENEYISFSKNKKLMVAYISKKVKAEYSKQGEG